MIVRLKELITLLGISRSTIYELMRPASTRYDSSFPSPIKLSKSAIGWRKSEIEDWLKNKQ